jgi:rSAM/selenodomain-associated transferase 1
VTGGKVLVFLKYPEPGKVKTRLAAAVGPERAAALYSEWVGVVLGRLQPLRGHSAVLGLYDGGPADRFAEWAPLVDGWLPQPAGHLGERLEAGFAAAHAGGGPVLAIGTDCLDLDDRRVGEAFDLLRSRDAVFGPATDGGYYLVGTARYLPGFFGGVRWSSPHTLADHLARCRERGRSVGLLPELADIDTWDDWQAYLSRRGSGDGHDRG